MTEELQKKAEDFIIDRYKIAECYREDNAETREYMRMDVHSQYEEEYQLYLDAIKELQKENAELKGLKDVATLIRANNDTVTTLMQLNNMLVSKNQQLTKAKELLKKYVIWCGTATPIKSPLQIEVEQFLKETGK